MTHATLALLTLAACAPAERGRTLVIAAYTTPREVLSEQLLPAFREDWRRRHGEEVRFETSYQGSGSQSRAVAAGLEADVVWLSLEPDVERLVGAGLVTGDWRGTPTGGLASSSVAVIGVREGNPLQLHSWADLEREGVEVLTPNVRTSGGAMWGVMAIAGAADRRGADPLRALGATLARVRVMDKGARESMLSFEKGVGDAIITYENEVVVARRAGVPLDYAVPAQTIRIENPAAVVDAYADRHGTRDLAEALVAFLGEAPQQEVMGRYGLRPVREGVDCPDLPALSEVFTVRDLGGWEAVQGRIFADGALYDQALSLSRGQR
ncbi:MAG: sulfate ABC transporter substrate-binding protein [Deltaproteobacteria bacterium]|nr:sulfate ABC transporter substrate-binding protein [Deltaproteobacteria bacterium]